MSKIPKYEGVVATAKNSYNRQNSDNSNTRGMNKTDFDLREERVELRHLGVSGYERVGTVLSQN